MIIDDFLVEHCRKDKNGARVNICYCEAIMDENGNIEYAIPSHEQALVRKLAEKQGFESGDYYELIQFASAIIPAYAAPIEWLCDYLNYTAIWYDYAIAGHNFSNKQFDALKRMKYYKENILSDTFSIKITDEFLRTSDNFNPLTMPDYRKEIYF